MRTRTYVRTRATTKFSWLDGFPIFYGYGAPPAGAFGARGSSTTIGLLVNKSRDKAAEKLRDGDVTDQEIRGLIVREIDDIKSKLDGLARKDLLASISFFEEGIELLYVVFDQARSRSEYRGKDTAHAACAEAILLAEGIRNLELTDLDESATRALSNAKKRFEDARREATRAFKNEALNTSDRILAMQYRVMATILETVDNPADAMAPCKVCIKEINSLSAVQKSFDVQLKKGIQALRGLFSKDERRKIISSVCRVNRVMYDVTQAVGRYEPFWMWPAVDTGNGNFDPIRDERITEVLSKHGMEHCYVTPWSFGRHASRRDGKEEYLNSPLALATNSSGQFIVADVQTDHITNTNEYNVKVFDSSGHFMNYFSLITEDCENEVVEVVRRNVHVATSLSDNFYVLIELGSAEKFEFLVYEFNYTTGLHHKFPLKEWSSGTFLFKTVDVRQKVLVAESIDGDGALVDVYETDGRFVRSFGEGLLEFIWDITAASDGRLMVTGFSGYDLPMYSEVHIFSEHGEHLNKFKLEEFRIFSKIAFHGASESIIVADMEKRDNRLYVHIYTKDGAFVRSTQIQQDSVSRLVQKIHPQGRSCFVRGVTVTTEGHIAILSDLSSEVYVV